MEVNINTHVFDDEKLFTNTKINQINNDINTIVSDLDNNLKFKYSSKFIATKWKGNNNFCCYLTVFISTNFYYGLLTILFIIAYSISFILCVLNNTISEYNEDSYIKIEKEFIENSTVKYILNLIQVLILSVTIIFAFLTTFTNPGFLKPNYLKEDHLNQHKYLVRYFY